ncbi:hypothetical protein [Burkholderia glumae]|uniref:hypothetical protein n=1 Tax=Burkholderia glumae TaxID=337 RepID=UPI000F5D6814|nr:hypothetical protein [Burkholderia glumae]CAJ5451202.1 Uncharacterised protein [Burkholderia pseudomallei]
MKQGTNVLDKYLQNDKVMASERFAFHLANPTVSLDEYRKEQRRKIREHIQSKRIIYLDTNAWKCLSDYTRQKTTLNEAMVDFAKTMNSDRVRENCVFPIGAATLFELQSMEDPVSISTLAQLVDTFSMNVGCQLPNEIIDQELALFNRKETRDAGAEPERFCHPMEITGTLEINIPNLLTAAETLAFKKTSLDILYALPTAAHLEMAAASVDPRWDNTVGIDEMNAGMIAHKDELKTFPDALLVELAGIMSFHVPDGPPINGFPPRKAQALMAMIHWKERPNSRHLITARLLANLHATVRHIENRKFRKGDIADFVTAQVALPSAHAFFTDKALANLLAEPKIDLKKYCTCEVLSGFDSFAAYLKAV